MKQKLKEHKGITLVALILTIIVLLILAVVAISAVKGDGIISHAKNARTEYSKTQRNEKDTLEDYLGTIESSLSEKISIETSYVGYYVDLEGDTEPDGIIYIDKAKKSNGSWRNENYTFDNNVTNGLKDYYISQKNYPGKLGTKDVLKVVPNSTGEERFYVMALTDMRKDDVTKFYWYKNAIIDDYSEQTSIEIGKGKINTNNIKNKYGMYGEKDENDIWSGIKDGWYVPSKQEWVAFASVFNITKDNYNTLGFNQYYFTSSLYSSDIAWRIYLGGDKTEGNKLNMMAYVRLGITF